MKKPNKKKPVIEMGDSDPNILAEAIIEVASAARSFNNSRLTTRAIHVLIKDKCGVPLATVKKVLDAASDLGSFVRR